LSAGTVRLGLAVAADPDGNLLYVDQIDTAHS
jgi:hypothetical protein